MFDGQLPAGSHSYEWDGLNADGSVASTGIYFYQLHVGEVIVSEKMMIVK